MDLAALATKLLHFGVAGNPSLTLNPIQNRSKQNRSKQNRHTAPIWGREANVLHERCCPRQPPAYAFTFDMEMHLAVDSFRNRLLQFGYSKGIPARRDRVRVNLVHGRREPVDRRPRRFPALALMSFCRACWCIQLIDHSHRTVTCD